MFSNCRWFLLGSGVYNDIFVKFYVFIVLVLFRFLGFFFGYFKNFSVIVNLKAFLFFVV